MSVLRCISILTLNLLLILESSSLSVLALSSEDIAVNSLESLSLPIETIDTDIASTNIKNTTKEIQPELKMDIQSLLDANREYAATNIGTNEEIIPLMDSAPSSLDTLSSLDGGDMFGDFLIATDTRLLEGAKGVKIKLDHRARTEEKVEGIRGTIAVNMATGTIISTLSGAIIDPTSIGIYDVTPDVRIKADSYHVKKIKPIKPKKGIAPKESSAEVFEFGIPGTHLIFSSPITISIRTPMLSDGNVVDLAVLHAGNSIFNTSGLSLSSDTLCDISGSASKPGSQAVVKNGKITFYTCGASSFTMNPTGGTAGSNDLKLIIGDCGQIQIYYNNLTQIYTGNPAATGCGLPGVWPSLRIGGTTYGNGVDGVTATAWTTQTTTGSTSGNTYTATSTMNAVVGGLTYTLIIDWSHTAPNKYLTWSYRIIVPTGNIANIRFYYGMDSYVAGGDANDTGYYTNTGGQTIGVYDSVANVLCAFRYLSGAVWTGYEAGPYATVASRITGGTDFANTYISSGDLGYGIDWNFGTGANTTYSGAVEWRLIPYVATNVVDLIPGIAQPEGPLTIGYLSQIPISLTNAGNLTSSGVHTAVLTLPTNISGPSSTFVDNGWSCGATVGVTVTCTKTMTLASLANDTFRIPVIPLPGAAATVTFSVTISNPGDSNTTNNRATSTNSVATATLANAPGGVTGMTYWTKADGNKNCNTAGCIITTWNNSGSLGAAANAVTGLGTVTYAPATIMNYNPTLYFNNASLNANSNLTITTAAVSVFTATRIAAGGSFLVGPQTAVANAMNWSTTPTTDLFGLYPATNIYTGANGRGASTANISSTSRATGGSATNRTDGLQKLTNAANVTAFASASIGIGRSNATNSTLANVGEVIIYPTEIIGVNRNKVETYLAIKYGITLDQSIPQDYTLSNTGVAWNSSIAGLYKKDIAGITRDDVSSLSQVKSQSMNNPGDIIVSSVSVIGTNYQSILWANDGTATGSFGITDAPSGYSRITREWQFQEKNGDLGNITIGYPATSLPSGAVSPIYMFIDADGTFAAGATAYTGTLNAGNWEFTVNIADMQYITFAQASDVTPPVISSVSIASGALLPIGNFPLVVTYSDTGSAINAGSFTGKIYSWDATGSVWNITNIAPSYMTLSGAATTSTGQLTIAGLPFGKYRFDISVSDNAGNTQMQSVTYYIDGIDWSISSDTYDIGTVIGNTQSFGTGEMIVTVRTVGAAFNLKLVGTTTLTKGTDTINYWNGTLGWGYDQWNGSAYLGTIISTGTTGTLANQAVSINTNGLKNTYTYRVKYGSKVSVEQAAGLYNGSMKMDLVASY